MGAGSHFAWIVFDALKEDLEKLGDNAENYKSKYIDKLSTWLTRKSRCLSPMITGGSNFPVAKNNKANDSVYRAFEDFINWRAKYFTAVNRIPTPSPEEDLDNAVKELDKLLSVQQTMKDVNKIMRSKSKTKFCELLESGLSFKASMSIVVDPGFKFKSFQLTNNNAKIKAKRDKILIMKSRIETKENFEDITFDGGYISIENDRVIIKHTEKPSRDVIDKIKSRGFRWSRNYGCWCRKHTARAIIDAKEIVGL